MRSGHEADSAVRRLILFVAGDEPNSIAALDNLRQLCASAPQYAFDLNVINVLEQYEAALKHQVLVTPCLVLVEPQPSVVVVGTLKDHSRVRAALRLPPGPDEFDG
jgi:circadian clock protein KaiB